MAISEEAQRFLTQTKSREEQIRRDGLNRYLIVPPSGGAPIPHTRVTTFIKAAANTYHLELWGKRMTAVGLARRSDLLLGVASCDPEIDKKHLNELCEAAMEAAEASKGRNLGSALHRITMRVDLGEEVFVPPPYNFDIEAYREEMARRGISVIPDYVEQVVVCGELGIAGQFDRLVNFGTLPMVFDLKTAKDLYWDTIPIQLAVYANSETIYDPEAQTHTPMPEVDKRTGIVAHLPAGQARCTIYFVDLSLGWKYAQLCAEIRQWQNRVCRTAAEAWKDDEPVQQLDVRRQRLADRIDTLRSIPDNAALKMLAAQWPQGVPTFKQSIAHSEEELNLIAMTISLVEQAFMVEFGKLDPSEVRSNGVEADKRTRKKAS